MDEKEQKRVLVVAYDFPPHGAIGTLRTLRLVRHLDRIGWAVTVLTGSPQTYLPGTLIEGSLVPQVPPGTSVRYVRAWRPYRQLRAVLKGRVSATRSAAPAATARKTTRPVTGVRAAVGAVMEIPDKENGWIIPAVVHALRQPAPDVVFSSAPPWSGHLVARVLARIWGCPWVADFRDPWARAPWRESRHPLRKKAARLLEQTVTRSATTIVYATAGNRRDFVSVYGRAVADKSLVVPNGCDVSQFDGLRKGPQGDCFVLLHAGTLYAGRDPMPVVRGVAHAIARGYIDSQRFRLQFLGGVSLDVDLRKACQELGLANVVEIVPQVSRQVSLQAMASASALLLIQPGTTVSVPGKLYEYLAAGRPILALTEEGESAQVVRTSGVGVTVHPSDPVQRVAAQVRAVIELARGRLRPARRELYDGAIGARAISGLLDDLVHRRRGAEKAVTVKRSVAATIKGSGESGR